jgi:hypothetical protein
LKELFQKRTAACKITRYRMARLIEFTCSMAAFVGAGISAFEATGNYSFNSNKAPEYLFSISDTSENTATEERAPPHMALVCVPSTSVRELSKWLPISAEASLSTLSTTLPSDTPLANCP